MQRAFVAQETSQRKTKTVRKDIQEHPSCYIVVMSQETPLIWGPNVGP